MQAQLRALKHNIGNEREVIRSTGYTFPDRHPVLDSPLPRSTIPTGNTIGIAVLNPSAASKEAE